ncbi:MAG: lytic transglycosylase domain-containing protein [Rhizobiaceae bacterium]
MIFIPSSPSLIRLGLSTALACAVVLPQLAHSAGKKDMRITGSVSSYASSASLAKSGRNASRLDISPASAILKRGLKALGKNRMKAALVARGQLRSGSLERKVMAWAIAMNGRGVDVATLSKISQDLAHWPGGKTIRNNLERALMKQANGDALRVAFSASQPESKVATIALAVAQLRAGNKKTAHKLIAPIWRTQKLTKGLERQVLKQFRGVLTRADHRGRVEYLLTKRRIRSAERIAGLAGATRLVSARAAVERKQKNAHSKLAAVPAFQRNDANYLLSKARYLRRANKITSAAKVLLSASPSKIHSNAADQFWVEQRILASDLVEKNSPKLAYRLASRNVAKSSTKRIDAEFYAGWIALRKLKNPGRASKHFGRLLKLAKTPLSRSRGHYWMGRALSKSGQKKSAAKHYAAAARYDTTYYGQLATVKLGRKSIAISKARPTRTDRVQFTKYELVQAIKKLESAGQHRKARTIYRFMSRRMKKPGELALLAAQAERQKDYQLSLQVGKAAFIRGRNVDNLAWPIGAIPRNTKTSGSGLPLAYAIARQESTFQVDARSHANALGLLQLLPTTAKRTARSIGVRYSRHRLVSDASYNARLGTAYLSQQMKQFGGSFILTFAAYNAGPRRAQEWVQRFGDPRGQSLDKVVDWVEQIPYSETRNYVQRVMENYQVYKKRLKGGQLTISRDLRKGTRG